MTALAQNTGRTNYGSHLPVRTWEAADDQVFYAGSLVLIKSDGLAYVGVAYATASSGFVPGHAMCELDTTIPANQGKSVIVQPGIYGDYDNSGTAAIAEDDRGKACYLENDNTLSLTDQGGTLTRAGLIENISDDGTSVVVQYEVLR
jgi:hypothetical protein